MLMRLGLGGAQRFRALLQSAPNLGKHQRSQSGADSLQPNSKGKHDDIKLLVVACA